VDGQSALPQDLLTVGGTSPRVSSEPRGVGRLPWLPDDSRCSPVR